MSLQKPRWKVRIEVQKRVGIYLFHARDEAELEKAMKKKWPQGYELIEVIRRPHGR